jgi:signal transduction histidine kinase
MELKALVEEFVEDYAIKRPNYFKVNGDTYGMWDCGRMAQVVSNLFDNAVKYSPAGTPIWVELDGGEKVTLKVTNIGQPILDPQAVFEAFYQTKVGPNGNGVGLGLYIVRHIIKLHNGSVEVENIPNEGKVSFKVTLPRDPSDLGPNS